MRLCGAGDWTKNFDLFTSAFAFPVMAAELRGILGELMGARDAIRSWGATGEGADVDDYGLPKVWLPSARRGALKSKEIICRLSRAPYLFYSILLPA